MIFLPYKLDSEKKGIPVFTLLVCFVCLFVYWNQYSQDVQHKKTAESFCSKDIDSRSIEILRHVSHSKSGNQCYQILESIREAKHPAKKIEEFAQTAKPVGIFKSKADDEKYILNRLERLYKRYNEQVPKNLTDELSYDPHELDIIKMITSTFSHGSLTHLLGNLLFFYVFAASVELIIGSVVFAGFVGFASIGTSLAYSYAMIDVAEALPTVGLSGIVMAAIAALGIMAPSIKIRCFLWYLFAIRFFSIPVMFLAVWYIGWDIYELKRYGDNTNINYFAHVSGAILGASLGTFYQVFKKDLLKEAVKPSVLN
ncbi:MAG: hypothetical protein COA99_02390 [Moraxellaceae bacterium]|nr:MAG: hypothetical protein COA99_02390 [Moraxellaceae bacterium]